MKLKQASMGLVLSLTFVAATATHCRKPGNSSSTTPPTPSTLREPKQHRVAAEECPLNVAPLPAPLPNVSGCKNDNDCKERRRGRCAGDPGGGPRMPHNYCSYNECTNDAECGSGVCVCGMANHCETAQCHVDADCGQGGFCSRSTQGDSRCYAENAATGFYCRTARDQCSDDADCKAPVSGSDGEHCAFDPTRGFWACLKLGCIVG